jgi:predicted site-specific integrase-resolvase
MMGSVEPETVKDAEDAEPVLLRPCVAARRIGVAVCTLAHWHRAGKITAQLTKGGQRRYPESEILALTEAAA